MVKREVPEWLRLNVWDWCVIAAGATLATLNLAWGTLRLMGWLPPPNSSPEVIPTDPRPLAVMFGFSTVYFGILTIKTLTLIIVWAINKDEGHLDE